MKKSFVVAIIFICTVSALALFVACSTRNGADTDRTGRIESAGGSQTTEEVLETADAEPMGVVKYIDPYQCEIDSANDTLIISCEDGDSAVFNGSDSPEQQAKDTGVLAREMLDSGRAIPRDSHGNMTVHFSGEYPERIEYSTEWCISEKGYLQYDSSNIVTTNTVEVDEEGNVNLVRYGLSPKSFSSRTNEHTYRGVRIKLIYDSRTVEYFVMLEDRV